MYIFYYNSSCHILYAEFTHSSNSPTFSLVDLHYIGNLPWVYFSVRYSVKLSCIDKLNAVLALYNTLKNPQPLLTVHVLWSSSCDLT
jgi:hypothetical protein